MTKPAIRTRDVARTFGTGQAPHRAVDGVSLEVNTGEIVTVSGPSGCGKSTLLAMIGGLDRGYSGSVELFGQDLSSLPEAELARVRGARLGFVFQSFHLLDHLSAIDNVTAPDLFADDPLRDPERIERGLFVLAQVGLEERAAQSPSELSGGQRQRVAIARALYRNPDLLLCDEPTGNLDRATGEKIIDLFGRLHSERKLTLLIVTHEDRVTRIAHRRLEMVDGRFCT